MSARKEMTARNDYPENRKRAAELRGFAEAVAFLDNACRHPTHSIYSEASHLMDKELARLRAELTATEVLKSDG